VAETLQFDAEQHRYFLGDRELPSVTAVLGLLERFEGVPAATLEAAREFGVHVHLACDLDNRGLLDEASLDPALAPYLVGWRKYRAESGIALLGSEVRLYDERLGYAGTCDVVGELNGQRAVIDIKSGAVPRTVGAQTAAYAHALGVRRRYCVQLLPNDYRATALKDPADWSVFVSCLNILNWRTRK
jgi:hypothetical protein